ncbi:hypothetical protein ACSVDA_15710 [Cytobacillus sp. Hm23]
MAITQDGKSAYVSNNGSSTISLVETTTHSVIATIQLPVSFFPGSILFTTGGKVLDVI